LPNIIKKSSNNDIESFIFSSELNSKSGISKDCISIISDSKITLKIPKSSYGVNLNNLIPTFTTNGKNIYVNSISQISEVTANNFVNPITYVVQAEDGSFQNYIVTLTLSTQTINFKNDDNGYKQIYTNDFINYNSTLSYQNNIIKNPMNTIEVQTIKLNGNLANSFGIQFCYQNSKNFYIFYIYALGKYSIHKIIDGKWNYYLENGNWSTTNSSNFKFISNNITKGYGAINTLKVINNKVGNFDFYINNIKETSINDSTFTGGDSGFIVFVSSLKSEIFPNKPEDIRFKLLTSN
jgi:hypothetical protein